MSCGNCGKKLKENSNFCGVCGAKIDATRASDAVAGFYNAQTQHQPIRKPHYSDAEYVKKLQTIAGLCLVAAIVLAVLCLVGHVEYQEAARELRAAYGEIGYRAFRLNFYVPGERLRNFSAAFAIIAGGVSGVLFYASSRR